MAVAIPRFNNGPAFTREEKMRIRTLYLVKGWAAGEIAEKMGKESRQVSCLANRLGWAKQRAEMETRAAMRAEQKAISDAQGFVEAVAIRGEELAMRGFDLADSAADKGDALAFSAASSGTKNFVALTRQALGIDAQAQQVGIQVNAFFARPEPVQVQPIHAEISAAPNQDSDDLDFA